MPIEWRGFLYLEGVMVKMIEEYRFEGGALISIDWNGEWCDCLVEGGAVKSICRNASAVIKAIYGDIPINLTLAQKNKMAILCRSCMGWSEIETFLAKKGELNEENSSKTI